MKSIVEKLIKWIAIYEFYLDDEDNGGHRRMNDQILI